jgi:hypothetical protein
MTSPSLNRPPVPAWGTLEPPSPVNPKHTNAKSNPSTTKQRNNSTTGPQPINLSLSEDERSPPNRANSSDPTQSPQLTKSSMLSAGGKGLSVPGQGSGGPLASPLETEDMLYEYFPLSVDDW